MTLAAEARELTRGRVVWNVNATAQGGGVAEMLHTLLGYVRASASTPAGSSSLVEGFGLTVTRRWGRAALCWPRPSAGSRTR